jgi:hypothetical protein
MKNGGCLCGAVRFKVTGALGGIGVCHCKMCRQWHGGPGPYSNARWDDLQFDAQDALQWYASSSFARRGFCGECGSSLFWQQIGAPVVSIAAGALDDPTGLRTERHIFVAHKGDWYEIADGLPQFPDGSPGAAGGG